MSNVLFFEYDERSFYGTWRVNKFETFEASDQPSSCHGNEIKGTEFILEEGGDVRWKIPSDVEIIPLFSCESYEVVLTNPSQLTFLSSSVGRIGPFTAEFVSADELQLTYDKAFILYCSKVPQSEQIQEAPFSFLPALERGYFSDFVVTSSTGKNYHVHRVIMKLGCPEQSWELPLKQTPGTSRSYQACVLDGLSNSVLETVLHYIYCESLPSNLTEAAARECLSAISKISGLEALKRLCKCYLENYAIRTQIEHLCDEIESSGKKINECLEMGMNTNEASSTVPSEPAIIFHAVKQAIKELAVAILKAIQLCKLFADHRNELSREERHIIMKQCRSRLPNLLDVCVRFFQIVSKELEKQTPESRTEMASYLLSEVEPLFDAANQMVVEVRQALEAIIDTDLASKHRQKGSVITRTLKNAVHIKELAKLRRVHGEMVEFINNLMQKREHFALLSMDEKVEAVSNVIECTEDEIPASIEKVTSLNENLGGRLSWTQWKYFFKMGSAKVAWIIEKLQHSRQSMANAVETLRKLIQRDDFDCCLAVLGLIDEEKTSTSSHQETKSVRIATPHDIESLSIPPVPRDSRLSAQAEELFSTLESSSTFTDVKFNIHWEKDGEPCTATINAHRVIVACRCDWFRRALLSGMKEDIQREINVFDCNPSMFREFLSYLYTGRLDCSETNIDTLVDMIMLSDRYELDALKCVCEGALKPRISNDNVLELLSIGEQFNASSLRERCMEYILEHTEVLETDLFNELPPKLQVEIRDLAEWNQRDQMEYCSSLSSSMSSSQQHFTNNQQTESSNDLTSEMERIDQLTHALHWQNAADSDSDDLEENHNIGNWGAVGVERESSPELESFVTELRNILGDQVSRDELVRIGLAADYDVNRALNFYFGSQ